MYSTACLTANLLIFCHLLRQSSSNIPLWIASASLSGISMLNSCVLVRRSAKGFQCDATNLLDSHNYLDGVETVKAKIIVEVRLGV